MTYPYPTSDVASLYTALAPGYDERYNTVAAHEEDQTLLTWVTGPHLRTDRILDLGCGTGLLLDLLGKVIKPDNYVGVDPSSGMRERFRLKHPAYTSHLCTAEDYIYARTDSTLEPSFDLILATFGSASYLSPETIEDLPNWLAPGGTGLLMFYRPGYLPDYHKEKPATLDSSRRAAYHLPGMKGTAWHDFMVVTFRG